MPYIGPDPSEALPIGEETLSPEDLGRLANFIFEHQQHIADLHSTAELTTEEREAVQRIQDKLQLHKHSLEAILELAKDGILHPPQEQDT